MVSGRKLVKKLDNWSLSSCEFLTGPMNSCCPWGVACTCTLCQSQKSQSFLERGFPPFLALISPLVMCFGRQNLKKIFGYNPGTVHSILPKGHCCELLSKKIPYLAPKRYIRRNQFKQNTKECVLADISPDFCCLFFRILRDR